LPLLLSLAVLLASCTAIQTKPERPVQQDVLSEKATVLPHTATAEPAAAIDERYTVGGLPKSQRKVVILENIGYAVGYSEEMLDPLWTVYYCGPEKKFPTEDRPGKFLTDDRVSPSARLQDSDYDRPKGILPKGTVTYDTGHMAPDYTITTRYGHDAHIETYRLTNVIPQRSTMNQQTWRYLEAEIARKFAPEFHGVWVITGPIFREPVVRYNGKAAIPAACYCIVIDRDDDGKLRALAVILDQTVSGTHPLSDFIRTIRDIENQTGLDFLSELPDNSEVPLEENKADSRWGWNRVLTAPPRGS